MSPDIVDPFVVKAVRKYELTSSQVRAFSLASTLYSLSAMLCKLIWTLRAASSCPLGGREAPECPFQKKAARNRGIIPNLFSFSPVSRTND